MAVVVDTSVALSWVLPDEASADADRVLDRLIENEDTILVPGLWVQETANAVVTAIRRGRLTEAQGQHCIELLAGLPIEPSAHDADQTALVAAALRYGLSAYDAAYLLLAERTGSALATLDQRLTEAAREAGLAVLP